MAAVAVAVAAICLKRTASHSARNVTFPNGLHKTLVFADALRP
jgi:hypothetical protein